ncbi:MAG TPA: hypothetical protein VM364_13580 [Vicinamibacterales bacterium]|nr:hypothetical protein [Vicinamibacterales bacterium]
MRVLRNGGILRPEHDPVIQETTELINIVATIIRNAERRADAGE